MSVRSNCPVFADKINQICIERHKYDRRKSQKELTGKQQITTKQLNKPSHHRRMIEMTPIRIKSVSPIINFVITKFKNCRKNRSYQSTYTQQKNQIFIYIFLLQHFVFYLITNFVSKYYNERKIYYKNTFAD